MTLLDKIRSGRINASAVRMMLTSSRYTDAQKGLFVAALEAWHGERYHVLQIPLMALTERAYRVYRMAYECERNRRFPHHASYAA